MLQLYIDRRFDFKSIFYLQVQPNSIRQSLDDSYNPPGTFRRGWW